MENSKKLKPKIVSAIDLTCLQPQERVRIIGHDSLRNRRDFLTQLCKTGVVVGLPMLLLPSCEPEIIYKATEEEDCPSHTTCNTHVACGCQTDSTATVPPKVVNTTPAKNSIFTLEDSGVEIRFDIDKQMDMATLASAVVIAPAITEQFDIHYFNLSKNNLGFKSAIALSKKGTNEKLKLLPDTTFTVTLKATAKDINGLSLDGNSDGVGGEDFIFSFTTVKKYVSCICQSDCSCVSYVSCSCQSDSCPCQSFYCSCVYAGCPLYRV